MAHPLSKIAATVARVAEAKERSGGVARTAAIDGGEWTGAGLAPASVGARLRATPRRDRDAGPLPARGALCLAAAASFVVHAAIVAAAALSLGAPQLTGEPDAIAVELLAPTDAAPTPAPASKPTPAAPASHSDAPAVDSATPPEPRAAELATPQPTEAVDAARSTPRRPADAAALATAPPDAATVPAPPKSMESAEATDTAPPSPPALNPGATQTVAAPIPVAPPPTASAPPEADFAAALAPPQFEPKAARTPSARAVDRREPATPPPATHVAASAPARGAAGLAAYRDALRARIWPPSTIRNRSANAAQPASPPSASRSMAAAA